MNYVFVADYWRIGLFESRFLQAEILCHSFGCACSRNQKQPPIAHILEFSLRGIVRLCYKWNLPLYLALGFSFNVFLWSQLQVSFENWMSLIALNVSRVSLFFSNFSFKQKATFMYQFNIPNFVNARIFHNNPSDAH